MLQNDDGDLVTSHEEISGLAITYFSDLIGTNSASSEILDPSINLPRLTDAQQLFLSRYFLQEDILATLKGMAKNKSPGPDGFTPEFYNAAWGAVGPDVTKAILFYFESLTLPRIIMKLRDEAPRKERIQFYGMAALKFVSLQSGTQFVEEVPLRLGLVRFGIPCPSRNVLPSCGWL
ncbi:hypothetical protein AgCh_025110 [Apium graveolens]